MTSTIIFQAQVEEYTVNFKIDQNKVEFLELFFNGGKVHEFSRIDQYGQYHFLLEKIEETLGLS